MTSEALTQTIDRASLTGTYTIDPSHSRFGFVVRHADPIRAQRPMYALADPFLQFHYAVLEPHSVLLRERDPRRAWNERVRRTGMSPAQLADALASAGARGILTLRWSNGWGVNKIFGAQTRRIPTLDLSCEDYGLVFRLAENNQGPKLRLEADAQFLGQVPVFNTIATIPGTEKPNEYVLLSAHFDSWDGASGATDNATGTVTMMEAMRILKKVYPNPKRTIIVGHWGGEEQGLNGSRAFAEDHPEIVEGLQALFNQDNGTGRVVNISMQGLTSAGAHFGRWFAQLPERSRAHRLRIPGTGGGGSDYASFVCAGAPAGLGAQLGLRHLRGIRTAIRR